MAVSLDSYRVKDVTEWKREDVREFIEGILPGHPCVDCFNFTTGFVLASLEKEDLRRQVRDEEAANVIWAQLKMCRVAAAAAAKDGFKARQDRGGLEGPPTLTVYVKARQEHALELEILPSDFVGSLKEQVAEGTGVPVESQRLICNGMNMRDDRSVASYDIRNGAVILLVPQLQNQARSRPMTFAPRGLLMVPGSKTWQPGSEASASQALQLPVTCEDSLRSFPVGLEFQSAQDLEAFTLSQEAVALEIQPARREQPPLRAWVCYEAATQAARLEAADGFLAPSSKYSARMLFGGRSPGDIQVTLLTGAAVM
mmetsp:Transcript_42653/g.90839  ORF Transcript_42653/g.90839 Transcript_42653/m.90839 type:complete len:313 (-) Transcript_42653:41-979(-)